VISKECLVHNVEYLLEIIFYRYLKIHLFKMKLWNLILLLILLLRILKRTWKIT